MIKLLSECRKCMKEDICSMKKGYEEAVSQIKDNDNLIITIQCKYCFSLDKPIMR